MPQQINLIDGSLRPATQRLPPLVLIVSLAVTSLFLAGHFGWERWALARALAQGVVPPPDAAGPEPDAVTQAQRAARLAQREALRDLLRLQISVAEGSAGLVKEIISAMPEDMWLTELEVGASRKLRISGAVADSPSFGQFTLRLERIAALKALPLHTVRLEPRVVETVSAESDSAAAPGRLFVLASGASEDDPSAPALLSGSGAKP